MKTFSAIRRGEAGIHKFRSRSLKSAISYAKERGFDRVFQGGFNLDSGWL
jgi:hypothetical protein